MRFGKSRKDADPPADEAVVEAMPAGTAPEGSARAAQDAVVEGEAEEIPANASAAVPPAAAFEPPAAVATPVPPTAVPFPVGEEPVAVATPGAPEREPSIPLGAAGETLASGHGPAPAPGWPDGIQKLAAERPEAVVGAAFVGGILAALILRRLGN